MQAAGCDVSADDQALLDWRPIFHIRNPEELAAILRQRYGTDLRAEPTRKQGGRVDVRVAGRELAHTFLHHIRWGHGFAVENSHLDHHYVVLLPTSGCFHASSAGADVVSDSQRAVIFSPSTRPTSLLRTEAPGAALNLSLSQAAVVRQLGALLGEPVHAAPEFAPSMDLTKGYGQSLASYLLLAAAGFGRAGTAPWTPIMASGFEDFIISKLLVSHPHNYSRELQRAERRVAPRDVKRAIDYMQARLGSPISIADIAETCGIAGRTLFKHFQDFHGISPIQYLRNARFDRARQALERAQPGESVTEIAMRWGFSHMGRFSVEYRKRFGESPGESLRRSHGRS
jgi:AraC-like DNA-binding protein